MTFLATDVVGSTERLAEIGDQEWRRILDRHDQLIRRHLDQFGGRDLGSAGDGFLIAFSRPMSAVACAFAIRSSLAGIHLRVRAGIHTGECEHRRDRFAGMALHVAARVSALAGASEILVTSSVKNLLSGSAVRLEERGVHELRGVPERWELFSVVHVDQGSYLAARQIQGDWLQRPRWYRKWRVPLAVASAVIAILLGVAATRSAPPDLEVAATYSARGVIASSVHAGQDLELRLVRPERSDPQVVGRYPVLRSLLWSDDGCSLAFVAGDAEDVVHVYLVGHRGGLSRVTHTPGDYRVLDWSASGRALLVSFGDAVGGGLYSLDVRFKTLSATSVERFDP
ncbi:MAG TPA: adenylate/guanylate cyclase domain-containing protein, partial [Actinomycetota bacterium]|nr:adenylate/guanylate cyclase domain-containing protein [Actinomycetota bacterium]